MHIHVPQTFAHKAMILDELQDFFMFYRDSLGKRLQMRKDFRPVPKIAAGKLTDNKRMAKDPAFS